MAKEILIANSNKADQEEFQKIFKTTDYHLIFSESGEDALLRIKLFKPNLIIAASGPSEKNGLELCEDIRADSESKNIPFILLSNIFGDISERDCKRVQADGIISKPLDEGEVLHLVKRLVEEEDTKKEEKSISEGMKGWSPFVDIRRDNPGKKGDLLLNEPGEEEIIELVDVVEEPEPKMSIDDFVHLEKEESFGEAVPFESWERIEEGVRPEERASLRKFKPPVTGFKLSPEEEDEVETEEMLLQLEKEITPKETSGKEVEFFEKIELEEILEKVEQLKPGIEKEWPPEKEWAPVKDARAFEKPPPTSKEIEEKYTGLEEFEAALKVEVKPGVLKEEIQPLAIEEAKIEFPKEVAQGVKSEALEEEIQPFVAREPKIEIPREMVKEVKPKALEKEVLPFVAGEPKIEITKEVVSEEMLVEEMELEELPEEEFPEELLEEVLEEEEIALVTEPGVMRAEEIKLEEVRPKEEKVDLQEIWPKEISIGEMIPEEIMPKEIIAEEVKFGEAETETMKPEAVKFEEIRREEVWPEEIGIEERVPEENAHGDSEGAQQLELCWPNGIPGLLGFP